MIHDENACVNKRLTILLLGLLTAIVPFSVDMYLPGFPAIAATLHTTVTKVAMSLSSFFIGIGLGQLVYGPLLDRFGRKPPLYVGLLIYIVFSIACAYTLSIEHLILYRFFQAIGACAGTIAAAALVRDLFPPHENARIFSFLILVLSVSPLLAPTLGGYVNAAFGWRSIFVFLTLLITLLLVGSFFILPHGNRGSTYVSLRPVSVARAYIKIATDTRFFTPALLGALAFSGLFTYIASSPGIFIINYGMTPKDYGLLFALLASGLTLASQINTWLLKRIASTRIIKTSLLFQTAISIMFLLFLIVGLKLLWVIITLLFLYLACLGFIIPNATALALKPFSSNAGSASALLGFFQMGLGSLTTILVDLLHIQSALPVSICLMITSIIALTLTIGRKHQHNIKTTQHFS